MSLETAETVAHLRRLAGAQSARNAARQAMLERLLPAARDILRQRGADKVFAFGSVALGRATETSDLDLAASGLPADAYFEALGELMRELPTDVDLVRLEEAPESLRDRIRAEGIEL